jgi:hypothetical protein
MTPKIPAAACIPFLLCTAAPWAGESPGAAVSPAVTMALRCNFAGDLEGSASDLAFNPIDDELLILDGGGDEERVLVSDSGCNVMRVIDTSALGIGDAQGITFDERTHAFVVGDAATSQIAWFDYATLERRSSCTTTRHALREPGRGLDDFAALGWVLVDDHASGTTSVLFVIDADCNLVTYLPAYPLGTWDSFGTTAATFHPQRGGFLYYSTQERQLASTTFEGVVQAVRTEPMGTQLSDVLVLPGTRSFLALTDAGRLYDGDASGLAVPEGVGGTFRSASGALVVLFDRGDGAFSGVARLPAGDEPVFGAFDPQALSISFGLGVAGSYALLTGTVSEDFMQIVLPPPLGTLARTFDVL